MSKIGTINTVSRSSKIGTINTFTFSPSGSVTYSLSGRQMSKNMIPVTITGLSANVKVRLAVLVENTMNAGVFTNKTPYFLIAIADSAGSATFYVDGILDAVLEGDKYKDAFASDTSLLTHLYRMRTWKYYYQYYDTYSQTWKPTTVTNQSGGIVMLGAQKFIEFKHQDAFANIATNKKWLSAGPLVRRYIPGTQEAITYMVAASNIEVYITIKGIDSAGNKTVLNYVKPYNGNSNTNYLLTRSFKFTESELTNYVSLEVYVNRDPFGLYPVSEKLTYTIEKNTPFTGRIYRFVNQWGGFESLITTGKRTDMLEANTQSVSKTIISTYTVREGVEMITDKSIQSGFKQSSGWLTKNWFEYLKEFAASTEVYEMQEINGQDVMIPVIIKTKKIITSQDKLTFGECKIDFEAEYLFKGLI